MKPDRSNYEIWFIDWLDGKLNENQITELRSFLEENPDLKEEIEMLPFLEIKPVDSEFAAKEVLTRSTDDYSDSQFEYMCVASLENDLSADQSAELMDIISRDEGKKRVFDMVSMLRLKPSVATFRRKSVVKKLTIVGKALNLAPAGLTAAASVAILVTTYLLLKPQPEINSDQLAFNTGRDTLVAGYNPAIHIPVEQPAVKAVKYPEAVSRETPNKVSDNVTPETELVPEVAFQADPNQIPMAPANVAVSLPYRFKLGILPDQYNLAGYHPSKMPPSYDPYGRRSNVDRFIARFFHERIMKDRSSGDSPVGSHELAEAGVKGLNKLLGWEMILKQKPDSSGNSKSYLFSSRLMKINTPVRKISDIL
jgi:hypothetical protein